MSFVGLYTGLSGLRAAQTGMDTATHNVANANTPGYTRQRVELAARPSTSTPGGQVGTGVDVTGIARLRDQFLDVRFRSAVGEAAHEQVRGDLLAQLEDLSGEPEQGISTRLGRVWDALEGWANSPDDAVARQQVIDEVAATVDGFRATSGAWSTLGTDTSDQRDAALSRAGRVLEQVHDLDRRLANADPDRVGPDLLDQRDALLDEIAELTGAQVRVAADGRSEVALARADGTGTIQLVGADGPATLEVVGDEIRATVDGDEVAVTVGGELGGAHGFLTDDLPGWQAELGAVAAAFVEEVNAVNADGRTADGATGGVLLVADAGDEAATIGLDAGVRPQDLAAAVDDGSGDPPPPHDATNAQRFASLRDGSYVSPAAPAIETRAADLVVGLAAEVRAARTSSDAASAVGSGAALARAGEHGVSLDEEMVDLTRYQRALEAAARVMTTVDDALDTLVNRTGRVGR